MKIKDRQTVLFIGDSITDCGRTRPIGFGDGLGDGYVAFADSLLAAWQPETQIRILNTGVSGDRVSELAVRWQTDVLAIAPDWLSVMIGINDVWQQFNYPFNHDQVTLTRYKNIYRELLTQTRPYLKGLVLMSPYFIEPNLSDPMRQQMDAYGRVTAQLAHEFDAVFVDVQAAFDRYLAHHSTHALCQDRIHPNKTGHMLITRAFLTAVGFFDGRSNSIGA